MNAGDLVRIWKTTRWGGRLETTRKGVVLRRVYLGYDRDSTRWEILESGSKIIMMEKMLEVISESC